MAFRVKQTGLAAVDLSTSMFKIPWWPAKAPEWGCDEPFCCCLQAFEQDWWFRIADSLPTGVLMDEEPLGTLGVRPLGYHSFSLLYLFTNRVLLCTCFRALPGCFLLLGPWIICLVARWGWLEAAEACFPGGALATSFRSAEQRGFITNESCGKLQSSW